MIWAIPTILTLAVCIWAWRVMGKQRDTGLSAAIGHMFAANLPTIAILAIWLAFFVCLLFSGRL